jgi:hypothetical protein
MDGSIIVIIIILILICLGAMFGFGYLYGTSNCESIKIDSSVKTVAPCTPCTPCTPIDPQQQLVNNIDLLINTNEGFENFPTCNRYNSKFKILLENILNFLTDQNGQFSKYFKYEDEFDENVDENISIENRKSSINDTNASIEKIKTNNKIIIDKISNFRQKIITGTNLDYYALFKEYVTKDLSVEYGSILISNGISKPVVSLSDIDITNIASNMVFTFFPMFLLRFWDLDYNVISYDKETDEIVYHPDFLLLMSNNNKFFSEKIQGKVSTELVKDKDDLEIKSNDDAFIINIIGIIKTKNPQANDIEQNIKNIKMEKRFKDMYKNLENNLIMSGSKKITEMFKIAVRQGLFGGGNLGPKPAYKYKTSKYFNKIDNLNINTYKCI